MNSFCCICVSSVTCSWWAAILPASLMLCTLLSSQFELPVRFSTGAGQISFTELLSLMLFCYQPYFAALWNPVRTVLSILTSVYTSGFQNWFTFPILSFYDCSQTPGIIYLAWRTVRTAESVSGTSNNALYHFLRVALRNWSFPVFWTVFCRCKHC